MIDKTAMETALSVLPLYEYFYFDTSELTFSPRIRWICQHECPMYGKSWACPPGVGSLEQCREKCLRYPRGLCISTIVEVNDISDIDETLATRPAHEKVTEQAEALLRRFGADRTFILSTEACAVCQRCSILDGEPCRFPMQMHPCVESQGIVISELAEKHGLSFLYGGNIVTWFSLILFEDETTCAENCFRFL